MTDWVAPDLGGGPLPGTSGAPRREAVRATRTDPEADRSMALRPMRQLELIDAAFSAFRRRPREFALTAAVFVIPLQFLSAWAQRSYLGAGAGVLSSLSEPSTAGDGTGARDVVLGYVIAGLQSLVLPILAAVVAHLVLADQLGRPLTLRQAVGRTWPRVWALVIAWLLTHLLIVVSAITIVGWLVFMAFFVVVAPAIAFEELGPVAGIKRSFTLTKRRFWSALGYTVVSGVIMWVLGVILGALTTAIGAAVGERFGWIVVGAGGGLSSLLLLPTIAAATVLYYLDLRIRTEGLDLELDARRVFAS